MTFKKYSMSPSALEEYRKLQLDLVDASDKMENMLAAFEEQVANSPLAEVLSDLSTWFYRREQEMEALLHSDDFKNRWNDRDYQWVTSFKNSFDEAQTVLANSEPCQLPEIDHYWSRPALDDLDRLFNQECDSQHGGPVEFEIEKKGDAPEVFELLWGDVTDYERDVEADASEDETGGA